MSYETATITKHQAFVAIINIIQEIQSQNTQDNSTIIYWHDSSDIIDIIDKLYLSGYQAGQRNPELLDSQMDGRDCNPKVTIEKE